MTDMKRAGAVVLAAALIAGIPAGPAPAGDQPALDTSKDKESYSVGYQFGEALRQQGLEVDLNRLADGIRDAAQGDAARLGREEMKALLLGLQKRAWTIKQREYAEQSDRNLLEGERFLADNRKKRGVTALPSGLQYSVLKRGAGRPPGAHDEVSVHYRGFLITGAEFDSSYSRGTAERFMVDGVIAGWTEALTMMNKGSRWRIFVPAALAYGRRGLEPRIPPNSVLIFDLELLEIFPANAAADAPVKLKLALAPSGFRLNWEPPGTNTSGITGFEIFRADFYSGPFELVAATAGTVFEWLDATARPELLYYYKVRAVRGGLPSPFSNSVSGERPAPPAD